MEITATFSYRLDLALRLVDTTTGWNIPGYQAVVRIDGAPVRFQAKADQMLIFQNLGKRRFRLDVQAQNYEPAEQEVDLDTLDKGLPLLELQMVPGSSFPGGMALLTLEGSLPGIQSLLAVRSGDNACMIREFDPRNRTAKIFNPHNLSMDRGWYALVDPDRGTFEPFRVLKTPSKDTIKTDRVLETPFKNYFPLTPLVFGRAGPGGSYCLRLRDDAEQARWLVRWEAGGEPRFKFVDFRREEHPCLVEGGG